MHYSEESRYARRLSYPTLEPPTMPSGGGSIAAKAKNAAKSIKRTASRLSTKSTEAVKKGLQLYGHLCRCDIKMRNIRIPMTRSSLPSMHPHSISPVFSIPDTRHMTVASALTHFALL